MTIPPCSCCRPAHASSSPRFSIGGRGDSRSVPASYGPSSRASLGPWRWPSDAAGRSRAFIRCSFRDGCQLTPAPEGPSDSAGESRGAAGARSASTPQKPRSVPTRLAYARSVARQAPRTPAAGRGRSLSAAPNARAFARLKRYRRLRREWSGARSREWGGKLREDRHVGVQRDPLASTNAARQQRPLLLQAPEPALDSRALGVEPPPPPGGLARYQRVQAARLA